MTDFDQIRAVKKAAESRLFAIRGVHAVGLGPKYVNGKSTGQLAIIVFLVKKKPLAQLSPQEVVPTEIDGVKTDVFESGVPESAAFLDHISSTYRRMVGGIKILPDVDLNAPAGDTIVTGGTLGFIAKTSEATPRIFGVSCDHVVRGLTRQPLELPPLAIDETVTNTTLAFSGSNTPGATVLIALTVTPGGAKPQNITVYYATTDNDTAATIAKGVAKQFDGLSSQVTASAVGTKLTFKWAPGIAGSITKYPVFGPAGKDPGSKLNASVNGQVITLSGQASGDYYGVYTTINKSNNTPTFGVFTSLTNGQSLESIAGAIAASINKDTPQDAGIIANATGAAITVIGGAQYLECDISSDTRIGQPGRCYCSSCCWCCGQQLGKVTDARLDLDVALVQLRAGATYRAEITNLGVVNGTYPITPADVAASLKVSKNGITTGRTNGEVHAYDVVGWTGSRFYQSAMSILGEIDPNDLTKTKRIPFADHGDSGSAVVTTLTNAAGNAACNVVGILFAIDTRPDPVLNAVLTYMTPISPILSMWNPGNQFPTLQLVAETASAPDGVLTVSQAAGVSAMGALTADLNRPLVFNASGESLTRFETRLLETEQEIMATPIGQDIASSVRQHLVEAQILFSTNRRVATVWRRSEGPQILQALARVVQFRDQAIPKEINGKPLKECLQKIRKILDRYASETFLEDVNKFASTAEKIIGLTYSQILDVMHLRDAVEQ